MLFSNGDGTFRNGATITPNLMDTVLLTADFNHDGNPDLLLLRASGQLAVVLGRGDGTFGMEFARCHNSFGANRGGFHWRWTDRSGWFVCKGGSRLRSFLGTVTVRSGPPFRPPSTAACPDPSALRQTSTATGSSTWSQAMRCWQATAMGRSGCPVFFAPATQACGAAFDPSLPSFYPCSYATVVTAVADFNGAGLPDAASGSEVLGLGELDQVFNRRSPK